MKYKISKNLKHAIGVFLYGIFALALATGLTYTMIPTGANPVKCFIFSLVLFAVIPPVTIHLRNKKYRRK